MRLFFRIAITVFLAFMIFSFLGLQCDGMIPLEYPYDTSILLNPNSQQMVFERIDHSTAAQLIGQWKGINAESNSYSLIRFSENGFYDEIIYSELTEEKSASIEGKYKTDQNMLTIEPNHGGMYQFTYQVDAQKLQLKALATEK
jgi:hypothetical protein